MGIIPYLQTLLDFLSSTGVLWRALESDIVSAVSISSLLKELGTQRVPLGRGVDGGGRSLITDVTIFGIYRRGLRGRISHESANP
jgi:hypothetical protein